MKLLIILGLVLTTIEAKAISSYLGTDDQLIHGPVTSTSTVIRDGVDTLAINGDGSINVGNTVNVAVTASTTTIQATGGKPITAEVKGSTTALHVLNIGQPDLHGKNVVYVSSDNFVTGASIAATGLIQSISLKAFGGNCNFSVNNGDTFQVRAGNEDYEQYHYVLRNATATLVSVSGTPICRSKIWYAP